jgi:osmotically inducible lipoprotein OsmB
MKTAMTKLLLAGAIGAALGLSGCGGMITQGRNTAVGAGVGAVGGAALTNGSTLGTLGAAATKCNARSNRCARSDGTSVHRTADETGESAAGARLPAGSGLELRSLVLIDQLQQLRENLRIAGDHVPRG